MLGLLDLTKIGRRLARLDRHLLQTLALRIGAGNLSDAVAEYKRNQQGPMPELIRKEIEDQRIAQAVTWAERMDIDPDYAAGMIYAVISESCRTQMNFLHLHFNDQDIGSIENNPDAIWRFYRKELLRLTKAVAPYYDDGYAKSFFATNIYLRFEKKELGRLIADLDDHRLALDLGCATGAKSLMLSENFKQVIGYDISPDMIELANLRLKEKSAGGNHVAFNVVDLEDGIPQENESVSLILMNLGTGSDIRDIDELLTETRRVLRPGGMFLFSFYNADSLLAKFGFLPWPTSLAAMIDQDKRCLEVHFRNEIFFIHARPYTVSDIRKHFTGSGLTIQEIFTHPTLSAILPEDIFVTETFKSYGDLAEGRRYHRAHFDLEDNQYARGALRLLEEELARSPQNLGAYIIATGVKEK